MHHDIIQNFLRHQKKQAVKVQVAFSTAASPSCPLIPYSDAPVGDANDLCIITNLLRDKRHRLCGKFLKLLLRKCRFPVLLPQPLFFLHPLQMCADPIILLLHKRIDLPYRHSCRCPHDHLKLRRDLNRKTFTTAADQCNFIIRMIHQLSPFVISVCFSYVSFSCSRYR